MLKIPSIRQFIKIRNLALIAGFLIFNSSCEKKNIAPKNEVQITDTTAKGFFICYEGNFQWGNADLGFYDTQKNILHDNIYKESNGKQLGDILQSMVIENDIAYLVVNNSQKIELMDAKTYTSLGSISGFNSPRFLLPLGSNKAYVSDLYENAVWVVDLSLRQITKKIAIKGWTEEMVVHNNLVYVCGLGSNYVYVLDAQIDALVDSIYIGYGAQNMVLDQNENIWVLTKGEKPIPAQMHCIKPGKGIEKTINFNANETPTRLVCNGNKTKLFWINKDIYSMGINETSMPVSSFYAAQGKNFYAMGFLPKQNQLVVSDAKDFVQKSDVFVIDSLGNKVLQMKAGINVGYFLAND
ncbi:MAG: hypothetical protein K9H61_10925 [Bacteroidia bacterium]|nr:hypothetical protein [Bacteroidia bacterium]MCF8447498.1 hypothetical protein [Bacteroidia bacterium]